MKRRISLLILTLGHFSIDFACLYYFFTNYPQNGLIAGIGAALFYNFLAFALQAPIGYFFDRFQSKRSTSIGFLFVLCGYTCGLWKLSATGLILCGFGNAFYHVGGSIGIARTDKKGLRDSGIFVSAGALGVSLGTYLAACNQELSFSIANLTTVIILLLLIALLLLQPMILTPPKQTSAALPEGTNAVLLILSLIAVFIRSVGGLFFPSSYRNMFTFSGNTALTVFLLAMASGVVAFSGKFLGGFLSNTCINLLHKYLPTKNIDIRRGNYIFGTITLLVSTVLLALGGDLPILCFLGIFCFHAAMPVTLFELYSILPEHPGFAMGLSTLMLFLGYLPYALAPLDELPASLILCILTLSAAGCMIASMIIYSKAKPKKEDKS
ncbi:MAG: hypothetical protein J6K04_13440 [Lachnospiraceae bacterium]|nr:hypothetical protein [Lachnospiraceae bacterium]